ncbi:uncharacterized protein LOC124275014 isoform X2 [Haliotis rubra]|uniref:uncharacterized protein LOC124275014 isoform X2 n=1 Tax=Haliotis rubra TaxID=36100 RepID=UPI001EE625E2|nr:uncharacterized protein LOC124275014 isoform X2 [Haliotis rubra]
MIETLFAKGDSREMTFHELFKHIPIVGPCYDLRSATVYLQDENEDMAKDRAKSAGIGFAADFIVIAIAVTTGGGSIGKNMILGTLAAAFGTRLIFLYGVYPKLSGDPDE